MIISPPINVSRFRVNYEVEDFYLTVSAVMPYKRVDIGVEAFNHLGLPLKIIGDGPKLGKLKAMASSNIEFLCAFLDQDLRKYYSRCLAFIFTPEEDYGITPLEAQASGRPVIAYGAGGALETVVHNVTGLFFPQQTSDSLAEAVVRFDPSQFDPEVIRKHAATFDVSAFKKKMMAFVQEKVAEYRSSFGLPSIPWPEGEKHVTNASCL